MKTIKYYFIPLVIGILLTSCNPHEYLIASEQVSVKISNSAANTLNLYCTDHNYPSWFYSPDTLHSLPSSTNHLFGVSFLRREKVRDDIFVAIKTKLIDKCLIVVDALSDDTLAKWNDSSIVFNDQQYWTIESTTKSNDVMYFDCTLNLTDEVLKLK